MGGGEGVNFADFFSAQSLYKPQHFSPKKWSAVKSLVPLRAPSSRWIGHPECGKNIFVGPAAPQLITISPFFLSQIVRRDLSSQMMGYGALDDE